MIAAIAAGLRNAVERYVLADVSSLPPWDETWKRLVCEDRGIVVAVGAGARALAPERVGEHISGYYSTMSVGPFDEQGERNTSVGA
jgi:GntR family transcriptional regulator, transcriptional repressor for pyruvate dehydrogenase complex